MNSSRWLLLFFALGALLVGADALQAAESAGVLQANLMMELVSNRARLVQVSLVCVTLGCALLWWKR